MAMNHPHHALALLLVAAIALTGCVSHAWSRQVVDGAAAHVGRYVSMRYHADGSAKELTIVYEDTTNGAVKAASRTGTHSSWNAFVRQTLMSGGARIPAVAKNADGDLFVAYMVGGTVPPNGANGDLWLSMSSEPAQFASWSSELVRSTIQMRTPPAIVYRPVEGGVGEIHIVYSIEPDDALWHSYRAVNDTSWIHMRVGGSFDQPEPDNAAEGWNPNLVVVGDSHTLWALYSDKENYVSRGWAAVLGGVWPAGVINDTGWGGAVYNSRVAVSTIDVPGISESGRIGIAHAEDSKARYGVSTDEAPVEFSRITPTIPSDPNRQFRDASFAFDGLGLLYLACYDEDVTAAACYIHNPATPTVWNLEFVDSGPDDTGRYTSTVYDSVGHQILIAYYDATNGDVKLAQRNAN